MRTMLIHFFLLIGTLAAWSTPVKEIHSDRDSARVQSVYIEGGGPSAIYSITYDVRLAPGNDGWGLRAGIGFFPSQGINHISIPLQVNYLLGTTRHFFEAGAGATYFHGEMNGSWFGTPEAGSLVFGTLSAGYRYQPVYRGITVRVGITGMAGAFNNKSITALPHISLGYRF